METGSEHASQRVGVGFGKSHDTRQVMQFGEDVDGLGMVAAEVAAHIVDMPGGTLASYESKG